MSEFYFNAEVAQVYGVDGAIFLHFMAFWVRKNRANKRHLHDGRIWTYNTLGALTELFPFWSRRQLERVIANLKDQGALLTGNYNGDKTNRTVWYALSDSVLEMYKIAPPISPNGEMDITKKGGPYHQTGKCNKDTVTNQLYIPPIVPQEGTGDKGTQERRRRATKESPDWMPDKFAAFWEYYRTHARKENKQGAIRAWDKLKPDEALQAVMGKALAIQVASNMWQRGVGIPYASTWLNGRRWEEVTVEEPEEDAGADPWDAVSVDQPEGGDGLC